MGKARAKAEESKDEYKRKLARRKQKLKDAFEELDEKKNALGVCERELSAVQIELASHEDSQSTIATLERTKSELEEDLRASGAKAAQLDDLKAQIEEMHSLKERITDQRRELDEANERNEKLGETNDQLASDCIRYVAELENSASKIATVQTAAEKQDRDLSAAKQAFVEAEAAVKQLEQHFAEAEGTVSTLQQRLDQMSTVCCV